MEEYQALMQKYCEDEISALRAVKKLNDLGEDYLREGRIRAAGMARICARTLVVIDAYELAEAGDPSHTVSVEDLLLNIRELLMFYGNCSLPGDFIRKAVEEKGPEFGLLTDSNAGGYRALREYPAWIPEDEKIDQVYALEGEEEAKRKTSVGDRLIGGTNYSSYKSFAQKMAVHAACKMPKGYAMLLALPTGAGKSLISHVLASHEEEAGLTLIIVPTVALAIDQWKQAKTSIREDIGNGTIFSYDANTARTDAEGLLRAMEQETARLLITSPEAVFKNTKLRRALDQAAKDKYLENVIVDEAHLVVEWGVKFRPEFQLSAFLIEQWQGMSEENIRTYLFSGTLSDDVTNTLKKLFGRDEKWLEYRCDALRTEPRFIFCEHKSYKTRQAHTVEAVMRLPKPLILYVTEPRIAEEYAALFREKGLTRIAAFTGETDADMRDKIMNQWDNDELDIVVGTSAFGMGVNKANVRSIVHACVPETLNRFYQEVGRAGRDGLPSVSLMLPYTGDTGIKSDLTVASGLVSKSLLSVEFAVKRWQSLLEARVRTDGNIVQLDMNTPPRYFSEEEKRTAGEHNKGWNINLILLLYRCGYIDIDEVEYKRGRYLFTCRLKDVDLLYDFEMLHKQLAEGREEEQEQLKAGYEAMKEVILAPSEMCWGSRFRLLYPYAEYACQGCPACSEEDVSCEKKEIEIHAPFNLMDNPEGIFPTNLHKYEKDHTVFIHAIGNDPEASLGIACIDQFDLGAIVVPDTAKIGECNNLVLSYQEFNNTARLAPWLFSKGILLVLTGTLEAVDTVYRTAWRSLPADYSKLLYSPEYDKELLILSEGKAVKDCRDFGECDIADCKEEIRCSRIHR